MSGFEVTNLIIPFLTALGIGGIVGAWAQAFFNQQIKIKENQLEYKKSRYLCIIVLMITLLKPDKRLTNVEYHRRDIKSIEQLKEELKVEALNATIFASDFVVESLIEFTYNPTPNSFIKTVKSMRKDLWGTKTNINESVLEKLI